MPFSPDQISVLALWAATLTAAAVLLSLTALVLSTRHRDIGGYPLIRFMLANALWAGAIALTMLPSDTLTLAMLLHLVCIAAPMTGAFQIQAVLAHINQRHRLLELIAWVLLALAGIAALDAVAMLFGSSIILEAKPMENPGLLVRATGNQLSFLPIGSFMGALWSVLVMIAALMLARTIWLYARQEVALLIGIVITGILVVIDGATAPLENAVALSFAANLVEAVVITSAQVRRVAVRLAAVEQASADQQIRLTVQLENLRQLQQLSLLGAETARITHDIRNPLLAVTSGVELLHEKLIAAGQPKEEVEELTDLTNRALERTLDLASGLNRTSRVSEQLEPFSVNECVHDARLLCARQLEKIRVEDELIPANIIGQSGELVQVLVNLLQNASEAALNTADPWIRISMRRLDSQIVLDVTDSGSTPPPHIRKKMFRESFTTKGNQGTGLGLQICQHVIEGLGGKIEVLENVLNTTVRVHLTSPSLETNP